MRWTHLVASLCLLAGTVSQVRADTPLTTKHVATGLNSLVYATHAPNDFTRLFLIEQTGRIRILDITQDPPVLLAQPFLDISSHVTFGGEQGLLGLAFHPNYASNGLLYVDYTGLDGIGNTHVARFSVTGDPNVADASSEVNLLTIVQPQVNHNCGWIHFGPDGYLYIGTGDGGGAGDDDAGHTTGSGNGQDITSNLLGKLLRIDVDGDGFPTDSTRNYAIPLDNPFVGKTGDDEIWAYGLRNPWRNAFDRLTGDLYIGDVGQNLWEEIDFQPAASTGGTNYGWRCREGKHDYNYTGDCGVAGTPSETLIEPIYEYSHGGSPFRCSITGGEIYRGCAIPDLAGTYFFADYCSNQIWSFRYTGGTPTVTERTAELQPSGTTINSIVSFGVDAYGEIYICAHGGDLFKIVPVGGSGNCQADPVGVGDDVCAGSMPALSCSSNADCTGTSCGLKNRYISFVPTTSGAAGSPAPSTWAVRVKPLSLPGFPAFEGTARWLDIPEQAPDENSALPGQTMTVSRLSCDPVLYDWSSVGLVHVYGGEILPGATYEVRTVSPDCLQAGGETCMSQARVIGTGKFGDVIELFDGQGATAQPDFNDISVLVDKFLAAPTSPSKSRAQLQPNSVVPSRPIDFNDISIDVSAFLGTAYDQIGGITGPCTCPSTVVCGVTACTSETQCGNGQCIDGFCRDACGRCATP